MSAFPPPAAVPARARAHGRAGESDPLFAGPALLDAHLHGNGHGFVVSCRVSRQKRLTVCATLSAASTLGHHRLSSAAARLNPGGTRPAVATQKPWRSPPSPVGCSNRKSLNTYVDCHSPIEATYYRICHTEPKYACPQRVVEERRQWEESKAYRLDLHCHSFATLSGLWEPPRGVRLREHMRIHSVINALAKPVWGAGHGTNGGKWRLAGRTGAVQGV
jgi:hypothetical protein